MATSLQAQTARTTSRPAGGAKARQDAAIARAIRHHQAVYYISNYTPTGSHIPQTVCRYEGQNHVFSSFANGRAYGSDDIGLTGSLNVGGALAALDPAVSLR